MSPKVQPAAIQDISVAPTASMLAVNSSRPGANLNVALVRSASINRNIMVGAGGRQCGLRRKFKPCKPNSMA